MELIKDEVKNWWRKKYFEDTEVFEVPFGMPTPTLKLHQLWIEEWEKEKEE